MATGKVDAVPISTIVTLLLIVVLVLSGIYIHRRGEVRSKGVLLAVALLVILLIGYLMTGGSAPG